MRFPISKIAEGEWCADSIAAKSNKTVHVATETLPLKIASLSGMARSISDQCSIAQFPIVIRENRNRQIPSVMKQSDVDP